MAKPSFFQRITGAAPEYEEDFQQSEKPTRSQMRGEEDRNSHVSVRSEQWNEEPGGELAVDVYQTADSIVVKAFIAGVQPNTVDISLTREVVTISGSRADEKDPQ